MCKGRKAPTHSGIWFCPTCDTDNTNWAAEMFWPEDYVAWHPGQPYPGAEEQT